MDDNIHIPSRPPLISPAISLRSSDSCVSSCSEYSVDVNSYSWGNQENGTAFGSPEDLSHTVDEQLHNLSLSTPVNRSRRSSTVMERNLIESNNNSNSSNRHMVKDADNRRTSDVEETREIDVQRTSGSSNEETGIPNLSGKPITAEIWEPPEAEDSEDDMEGSVANYDDDDDESGEFSKSSSWSSFRGEGSGSYRFKEEREKAIEEVINGKFKVLVSQLLKSFGVDSSGSDGESWVDIVTSLSWEAASFLKPDAIDGKAMDPDGYVKVKCIPTGSRHQSQLIKGLVFKKHAAHKHMPTEYKNPKLLLIRGMLGQSTSSLSSFGSMEQENEYLKSITEMIEMCQPNVILVEKSVSRDVQESILEKRMTLVFDMKLHRLERVARCTGSPIISSDSLMNQKLKQCDYFHIEKFKEEHAIDEGGKRPSKTLMFLEGCPTRQGCTILLKGSHSNELKRIKCVVQCTVVMAYQFILETSFLVDQKAMFSTIPFNAVANVLPTDNLIQVIGSSSSVPSPEDSTAKSIPSCTTVDIPISSGIHEGEANNISLKLVDDAPLSYEHYNPAILSGLSSLSDSVKKVIADRFPLVLSTSYPSLSSYLYLNGKENESQVTSTIPVLTSNQTIDHCDMEAKGGSDEEKSPDNERSESLPTECEAPLDTGKSSGCNEDQVQSKDNITTVLDSRSILVLMSSRNAFKGNICEQSHFSHIKFYRNFDVPLGKFLRDNILNQRQTCSTCGELPEAHLYYYAHHGKQLTVQVKRLPEEKRLPGETEGKLWMWSRCGKCNARNGTSNSTKRVLISTAARGLSFGQFLELSSSHQSSWFSGCGHSLHGDFFHFFGLGPMVAMFSYSLVATYTVSMPPQKLEFNNSIRQELLHKELDNVFTKGMLLFEEVANSLQKLGSKFKGSTLKLHGSLKEFPDIEMMLKQERSQFEVKFQNAFSKNENPEAYKFLQLNRLLWELLLESCIWNRRLHTLLSPDPTIIDASSTNKAMQEKSRDGTAEIGIKGRDIILDSPMNVLDNNADLNINVETCVEVEESPIKELLVNDLIQGSKGQSSTSAVTTQIVRPAVGDLNSEALSNQDFLAGPNLSATVNETCQEENFPSDNLLADKDIPISSEPRDGDSVVSLDVSKVHTPLDSMTSNFKNSEGWVWAPFSELEQRCMKDLQGGVLHIFEPISSYIEEHLPSVYQIITEEGSRLHIPLGNDDYIVSDYEGELSSVIACALAKLKDRHFPVEYLDEDYRRDKGIIAKTTDSSHSLPRIASMTSPRWSSSDSLDSNGFFSKSVSFDESRFSSFDGQNWIHSLASLETLHPDVSLGVTKLHGKGRYSVVCLYAGQFRGLRNRCCPSEQDYIASLSRCRNWDAKGGKSKAVFAKTLDDRFIIKEIKKTEFESFMKFAPAYFKYMNQSFESGNQTCLAKILGIYQVVGKQPKSGKEMKHDLMVMENLSYGRKISRQYDLKGALHARLNLAGDGSGDVLLDQNFVNDMNASPLYVSNTANHHLKRAIWNDTTFLNSINVMDYSLLVGVDSQSRDLVCGIIDYLRQYTWDKQLETWVKSSLVVPKNLLPTVISPIEYKKRFRKFMSTHFLSVPDDWCSQSSSKPCELSGLRYEDSSEAKPRKQGEKNGSSARNESSGLRDEDSSEAKPRKREQNGSSVRNESSGFRDGDSSEAKP